MGVGEQDEGLLIRSMAWPLFSERHPYVGKICGTQDTKRGRSGLLGTSPACVLLMDSIEHGTDCLQCPGTAGHVLPRNGCEVTPPKRASVHAGRASLLQSPGLPALRLPQFSVLRFHRFPTEQIIPALPVCARERESRPKTDKPSQKG